jgi:hypothetical protein
MKLIAQSILIVLLAFALGLYLPWWSIAVASFAVGAVLGQRSGTAFLSGFLGGLLLWGAMAMVRSHLNDHILAKRFAPMVLGVEDPFLLIGLTALLAGVVAGMSALTGCLFRKMVSPPATES